ncbi:MAG: hypothetical protein N2746_01090 [Deltaproteobacteria bacterium]|nr:hypothetical protein [Deltaproteobacteria bacterium]
MCTERILFLCKPVREIISLGVVPSDIILVDMLPYLWYQGISVK